MSSLPESIRTRENTLAIWRRRLGKVLITIALMVVTMGVIIPFLWMVIMSFRTTAEILTDPYGLPKSLDFGNYITLITDPQIAFYKYFLNSVYVTLGALVLTVILSTLGGYGFGRSRYEFKFRGWLFAMLLFALMLPPQIMYLPQFTMMSRYGLLGTRWSLILLYTATALPVSTYLMATYFSQLPAELEDAARIDGCNDFGMFWRVMLPLTRPAVATVVLINFLHFWNELLLAITMITDPNKRTIQAAMMMFVGEHGSDYAIAAASLVVSMLPVLILYLFLSDKFIQGLTAGAVKG
jgi:raffinose/stachyose/melibiose transport system permease protein